MVFLNIFKGNESIAQLPEHPKDFDCTHKDGVIKLATPSGFITLGKFDNASQLVSDLLHSYLDGIDSFNLP